MKIHMPSMLVVNIAFCITMNTQASYVLDKTLPHTGQEFEMVEAHFSHDGKKVITTDQSITAYIWDANTGQNTQKLKSDIGEIKEASFSPNDKKIIARGKSVTIFDVKTGSLERALDIPINTKFGFVRSAAFSPDGTKIAVLVDHENFIRILDAATGKELLQLINDDPMYPDAKIVANFIAFAWSPDSNKIAARVPGRFVYIFDTNTGKRLHKLGTDLQKNEWTNDVAFSHDGNTVATAHDQKIMLWDANTGQQKNTIMAIVTPDKVTKVISINFSPDNKEIASATGYGTIHLYDARTGDLLETIAAHDKWVNSVEFSPRGNKIVTGSDDGTARIWKKVHGRSSTAKIPSKKS